MGFESQSQEPSQEQVNLPENLEKEIYEAKRAADNLKRTIEAQLQYALDRGNVAHLKLVQEAFANAHKQMGDTLMTEDAFKVRGLKE